MCKIGLLITWSNCNTFYVKGFKSFYKQVERQILLKILPSTFASYNQSLNSIYMQLDKYTNLDVFFVVC